MPNTYAIMHWLFNVLKITFNVMKKAELLLFLYIVVWTFFYISKLDNAIEKWTEKECFIKKSYIRHIIHVI